MGKLTKENKELKDFSDKMEDAYDYFEQYKQIPIVMIKDDGQYVVSNALPKVPKFQPIIKVRPKTTTKPIVREIHLETAAVAKWPEFTGGTEAYTTFLKKLGKEMIPSLPDSVTHTYAQVEFIVDKDGTPVNFKILRGLDKEFNDMLIEKMQQMPKWSPAIYREKPTAKKMVQTVTVGID
ncbi:energy transducer TonB [Niabella hibiscisoli]|uniref:energy transducer TonB n=1 Tax=Niabella hibiscisoli TaxID=1825928 RepID=UPI001F10B8F5|nr:hypothetical protein [Niabella hibiscisoli]MCH5718630.1 hypothetical protein [Niabella hibiscisoli]